MKVKELIAALQLCDPDLEVYSYCDHGQTPEKAQMPSIIYSNAADNFYDEYTMTEEDAEEEGYIVKAIVL